MVQDDYRDEYKKINKAWNDSVSIYRQLVKKNITSETTVLEAGAGFSNMFENEYKIAKKVIGVDINADYLNSNNSLTEKYVAPLEDISPIKSSTIDLVISSWVLEHVSDADLVFKEISRVLKPEGKFIFITPNALNYILIGNRFIGIRLRNFLARKLTKDLVVDPMPAYYKANTEWAIKSLASKHGMKIKQKIINGDPTYLAFNKPMFYLGIFIEALLSLPLLRRFKVHYIMVLQKQ